MSRKADNKANNTVRIIGGRWRRRKLEFPPIEGLRPTPDRVRETVFNWLHPQLAGARVLDAYCGSGALGLECLSRGAAEATFVDLSTQVCQQLRHHLLTLEATAASVHQQAFLSWIERSGQSASPFDIVFIDPPYHSGLLQPSIDAVLNNNMLAADGCMYIECEAGSKPLLPPALSVNKTLNAGNNCYQLVCLSN